MTAGKQQRRVYWLDNEPHVIAEAARTLVLLGYFVRVFDKEEGLIEELDTGNVPDIIIQDLHRRVCKVQIRNGAPRGTARERADTAGWNLYETVLRPYFPQVPTIIVSVRGGSLANRILASDYNVRILEKGRPSRGDLAEVVSSVLRAQLPILVVASAPPIIALDFQKVNERLLDHLGSNPTDIHRLDWRTFEQLIERLLTEMGYEVERTRFVKDGGVDLWAMKSTELATVQYAIDTKHYGPQRRVGVEHVRSIYGVAQMSDASVGMIVTSSMVTSGAREVAQQLRHRVSLKEYDDIMNWIRDVNSRLS